MAHLANDGQWRMAWRAKQGDPPGGSSNAQFELELVAFRHDSKNRPPEILTEGDAYKALLQQLKTDDLRRLRRERYRYESLLKLSKECRKMDNDFNETVK